MIHTIKKACPIGWAFLFLLISCTPSPEARRDTADTLAAQAGLIKHHWPHPTLPLLSYQKLSPESHILHLFIEGDGYAFASRQRPSSDPTPVNPIGLKLAAQSPHTSVAYLARPCHYTSTTCDERYWTSHRFADDVIKRINDVISQIKQNADADEITLTGYSGGGVIAALLAIKRNDVHHLTTMAAPLDLDAWLSHHRLSPLEGENPAHHTEALCNITQTHHWGKQDVVVPPEIMKSFERQHFNCPNTRFIMHPERTHENF